MVLPRMELCGTPIVKGTLSDCADHLCARLQVQKL